MLGICELRIEGEPGVSNDPKVQAHLKDLQVGQTVDAIRTEVLKVETSR